MVSPIQNPLTVSTSRELGLIEMMLHDPVKRIDALIRSQTGDFELLRLRGSSLIMVEEYHENRAPGAAT